MASSGVGHGWRDEHGRCRQAHDAFIAMQVVPAQLHIARDAYESGFATDVHIVEGPHHTFDPYDVCTFRYVGWLVHFRVASRHFWLRCGRSRIEASRDEIIDGQWCTWTCVGIDGIGYLDADALARCPACAPPALDELFSSLHVV